MSPQPDDRPGTAPAEAPGAGAGEVSVHFGSLVFGAEDPGALARFWAGVLQRELVEIEGRPALPPDSASGLRIDFAAAGAPREGLNQLHFDLTSSSLEEQRETVERALELGAAHLDVGQLPEEGHVVLADPEGNEFCVLGLGSSFLDGCGFLGALSCDGTREVGLFWHHALGWPLVWDEGEETAIQSSLGGSKVTWGGPPVRQKKGRNRMHFEVIAGDLDRGTDRLLTLGATRVETPEFSGAAVELADPDGNEFVLREAI